MREGSGWAGAFTLFCNLSHSWFVSIMKQHERAFYILGQLLRRPHSGGDVRRSAHSWCANAQCSSPSLVNKLRRVGSSAK